MTIIALLIVVLTLILFSWEVVLVLAIAALLLGLTGLYCQRRLGDRYSAIDLVLFDEDPGPVIADRHHPLYCIRGARRGPEPPPSHTAAGRFRG